MIKCKYFAFVLALFAGAASAGTLPCHVVGVADGDTIHCLTAEKQQIRVRLAEIDAPESKQAFGNVSKQSLSGLVFDRDVNLSITDQDKYGRYVAHVFVDGKNVNLVQVQTGMAWVYRQYSRSPEFADAESRARSARLGLWVDPQPVAPWLFRRK